MALSGIQIFKMLPKKNCKECGCPTCMAFSMKVAQGALKIEQCPHVSSEALEALSEATAPPMKTIKVGTGEGEYTLGGETVLYRHEKTYVNKTRYAVSLCSCMDDVTIDAKIAAIPAVDYERIGERMHLEMIYVNYGAEAGADKYLELVKKLPVVVQEREFSPLREDDYLRHYRKLPHRHYNSRPAIAIQGKFLPFDQMAVLQGTIEVSALKTECRKVGVSITKYLAAVLLWAIIQTETDGKTLKRPVALNLPVNLRSFFESETLANFFAVVNISWAAGKAPEALEEVIASVSRQMDEQIVKERLEETISYNVSNEKKWYVRAIPLFVKHLAMQLIFLHTSRAHTMTFSNIGPAQVREELKDSIEGFQLLVGASPKQRMKCGAVAYDGKLCLSFTSAMAENRLPEFFFHFLEEKGIRVERESNGITDTEHDKGRYPVIAQDRERVRRAVRGFYVSLVLVSLLAGLTNLATYHRIPFKWSLLTAGAAAYVAMTLRFSVMRHASLAGTLVRQSLGIQAILLLIDALTGLRGWSVDYAIPCVALFEVAAVLLMMLVNRMNWQSYFMYQITITFLSFVPLIFWKIGWTHHPRLTVLAAGVSVAALAATVILGDRSVKRELKRRFHV